MLKINKDFNAKIISMLVIVSFLFNSTVYGIGLPRNTPKKLRVPVGNSYERMLQAMQQKYGKHETSLDGAVVETKIVSKLNVDVLLDKINDFKTPSEFEQFMARVEDRRVLIETLILIRAQKTGRSLPSWTWGRAKKILYNLLLYHPGLELTVQEIVNYLYEKMPQKPRFNPYRYDRRFRASSRIMSLKEIALVAEFGIMSAIEGYQITAGPTITDEQRSILGYSEPSAVLVFDLPNYKSEGGGLCYTGDEECTEKYLTSPNNTRSKIYRKAMEDNISGDRLAQISAEYVNLEETRKVNKQLHEEGILSDDKYNLLLDYVTKIEKWVSASKELYGVITLAAQPAIPSRALQNFTSIGTTGREQEKDIEISLNNTDLAGGFKSSLDGKKVHIRGISVDPRIIHSYITALAIRNKDDKRAVPEVYRVYVPRTRLDVNATIARRKVVLVSKGEAKLPSATLSLLRDAQQRELFQVIEMVTPEDYQQMARDFGINENGLLNVLTQSNLVVFVSDWIGPNVQDFILQHIEEQETLRTAGIQLGEALLALHSNRLIANDTHLGQFVVRGLAEEVLRIDLVNIYSLDEVSSESIAAEYQEISSRLIRYAPVLEGFLQAYPPEIASKLSSNISLGSNERVIRQGI